VNQNPKWAKKKIIIIIIATWNINNFISFLCAINDFINLSIWGRNYDIE